MSARWLVNLLAAEVVQPLAAQVINFACPDVSDVMSLAVEYSSVHGSHFFFGRSTRVSRNSSGPLELPLANLSLFRRRFGIYALLDRPGRQFGGASGTLSAR